MTTLEERANVNPTYLSTEGIDDNAVALSPRAGVSVGKELFQSPEWKVALLSEPEE